MRTLNAIAPPEEVILPVALPVPGSNPLRHEMRSFRLTEQTPVELCEYFAARQEARTNAQMEFMALPKDQRTKEASFNIWSSMFVPLLLRVLSSPVDGPPVTSEEITLLTHSRRAAILQVQEDLSGLEVILKNAVDLMESFAEASQV